jgi:hypothetical protein
MTEQVVRGVVSNEVSTEVDIEGREIVPKTATVPSKPVNVIWQADGPVRLIGEQPKTLAERVADAYGDGLEPGEREILDRAAEQLGRRLSNEE